MWRWSLNCIETMGCWRLSNYDRCFEESCMYKVEFLQKKSYVHCSLVHVMNELLGPFADCVISSWYPVTRDRATWFIVFPSGFKSWSFLVVHSILLGTSVFCSMPFFVCVMFEIQEIVSNHRNDWTFQTTWYLKLNCVYHSLLNGHEHMWTRSDRLWLKRTMLGHQIDEGKNHND